MKEQILLLYAAQPETTCFDNGALNDNDAYVPEHWAMESLMILEESMVMSRLVHRDFQSQVANFGDVVNTRRPSKFYSSRKIDTDDVTEQDAISTNVQVPLDQHHYNSFIIKDGEGSKSFKSLVDTYLRPAIQAVGRGVDRSVVGQVHRFIGNTTVGRLGGLSSANARTQLVEANEKMNLNNVPGEDRRIVLSPTSESAMLNTDLFVASDQSGTTEALRRARIGQLFNFDIYRAVNTPTVSDVATDVASGTVTSAIAAGTAATSQAVTLTGHEAQVGEWATVAGNDQPQYVTAATVGSGNTTAVTLDSTTVFASSAGAVLKVYQGVLATAAYAVGWSKEISVDGWTNAPQPGQLIATGTGATRKIYAIIESRVDPTNSSNQLILLDRPLEVAIADNDGLFPGPAGSFNLAFHPNALAFVTRPLALPNSSLGVMSAIADYNDLSIRLTMQYDSKKQGTRVTADLLSGVALLDAELACLFLG